MDTIQKLRVRYERLLAADGISSEGIDRETIDDIQAKLNVYLPDDFCEIASFCNGGLFRDHSFANFNGCTNIIDETIRLRKTVNLPLRFVVLAEPDEGLIVMDTENTPSIIWCDATEVSKLDVKSFVSKPDEWNTYAEFFAYLIEDEEEERIYE